jgi:protease I
MEKVQRMGDLRVAVLATDGFEESELTEPVKALRDAGARVTILSLKPGQIQDVRDDLDKTVRVKVDRTIRDVSAGDRLSRSLSVTQWRVQI